MRILPALVFALFQLVRALSVQAGGQTNGPPFTSAPTNAFSLDQNDIRDFVGYEEARYLRHVAQGEVMSELLPASQDTNGNWGMPTNGLQLSLRIPKNDSLIFGSVVPAETVLRNLEPYSRTLLLTNSLSLCIHFLVQGTNGNVPECKYERRYPATMSPVPALPTGFFSWVFAPKSEKILGLDLNKLFVFGRPGEYTVRAICRVYSPTNKMPLYEISSGTASFRLLPKPPPNGQK